MVQAVIQTTVTGLQGTPLASPLGPTGNQALVWNGTAWAPAGPYLPMSGGTLTGPLTLSANAAAALQPVSLQQLQAGYLPLTGGTISGSLVLTGNLNANAIAGNAVTSTGGVTVGGALLLSVSGANIQAAGVGGIGMYGNGNTFQYILRNADPVYVWQSTAITIATMDSSGNLSIHGGLSQGSDASTKNTIAVYAPGVSLVAQLLPKTFIYNGDANNTQHLGFIAQDVQPVIPDAVSSSTFTPVEGGSPVTTMGIDATAILAVAVNAIKQLISRIQALESNANISPPAAATA